MMIIRHTSHRLSKNSKTFALYVRIKAMLNLRKFWRLKETHWNGNWVWIHAMSLQRGEKWTSFSKLVYSIGEGLQPLVKKSTICSLSSWTLRSHTWLRKTTQEVVSFGFDKWIYWRNFLRRFVKPCLTWQSSWAKRTNCGSLDYCLEPFMCCWKQVIAYLISDH